MSHSELIERLRSLDELLLLELLEITSNEIVDKFLDKIIEKNAYLRQELPE
jgi:hypothetical protein